MFGNANQSGFKALALYGTNKDGKIVTFDDVFKNLKVWVDRNGDGRTDEGELMAKKGGRVDMRWFRKFWVVLIFVLVLLQGKSWSEGNKRDYTVQTDFNCGGVDVKVITHCIYKEEPLPCLSDNQNIIIGNKKIVSSSTLLKLDHSIYKIACYKSNNNEWFIELYYSNLGNCPVCEYYELYNVNGNLVATDREKLRVIHNHDTIKVIKSKNYNEVVKKYSEIVKKLKEVSFKDINR